MPSRARNASARLSGSCVSSWPAMSHSQATIMPGEIPIRDRPPAKRHRSRHRAKHSIARAAALTVRCRHDDSLGARPASARQPSSYPAARHHRTTCLPGGNEFCVLPPPAAGTGRRPGQTGRWSPDDWRIRMNGFCYPGGRGLRRRAGLPCGAWNRRGSGGMMRPRAGRPAVARAGERMAACSRRTTSR
jgi:hypothetical protein